MTNNEIKMLLGNASLEITRLRRTNEAQRLRLQMFDDVMILVRTPPPYMGGYMAETNDIVNELDKALDTLIKEDAENKDKKGDDENEKFDSN